MELLDGIVLVVDWIEVVFLKREEMGETLILVFDRATAYVAASLSAVARIVECYVHTVKAFNESRVIL